MVENIKVQGIFRWIGSQYRRLKKVKYEDFTRERKIFFALDIPNEKDLSDKDLAARMIIDIVLDDEMESPVLITDPQKVFGGFMMPMTEQEITDYPGRVIWLGWVEIPRAGSRWTEPGEHNITIKAALRAAGESGRVFDEAHAGVVKMYKYEVGPIPDGWNS